MLLYTHLYRHGGFRRFLRNAEPALHSWDKPQLAMILFRCSYSPLARNFLTIFPCLLEGHCLVVVFFCNVFFWFWCWVMLSFYNELGHLPSSTLRVCVELALCFLKYLVQFAQDIWAWSFYCWKVLDYKFNFYNRYKLFRLSVSSWSNFGSLCLLRNFSILFKLSN